MPVVVVGGNSLTRTKFGMNTLSLFSIGPLFTGVSSSLQVFLNESRAVNDLLYYRSSYSLSDNETVIGIVLAPIPH